MERVLTARSRNQYFESVIMKSTRSKIEEEKVLQIFLFFFQIFQSHRDFEEITKKEKNV